jgi:hypothetical protein
MPYLLYWLIDQLSATRGTARISNNFDSSTNQGLKVVVQEFQFCLPVWSTNSLLKQKFRTTFIPYDEQKNQL